MHSNNVHQLIPCSKVHAGDAMKMVACTAADRFWCSARRTPSTVLNHGGVAAYLGDARQRNTSLFI